MAERNLKIIDKDSIIINLEDSRYAKVFDNNSSLIHYKEIEKVKGWIDERLNRIKYCEENNNQSNKRYLNERLHDTITILGTRGCGKTTFLQNLLNYYKDKDMLVLDIIDPTLIEEKGHIFLTIISEIKKLVDECLSKDKCIPCSVNYQLKTNWEKLLNTLADGLPSITNAEVNCDDWQDSQYVMNKGLDKVRSAKDLEKNFNILVKCALKILDKRAIIITLDDIDIDFKKGWPVLETIRKYLTSPYIITILSGDLQLFSKAIRKQQWSNFGKALLVNEAEKLGKIEQYDDLVTEMESQYMQKVMQSQRRIHLGTLKEKLATSNIEIWVHHTSEKEDNGINTSIGDYYDEIFKKYGVFNKYQSEVYRSFMLNLPLRTQIQFLYEENSIEEKKIDDKKNNIVGNKYIEEELNVLNVFLSDLYEQQIDIDLIKANDYYLNPVVLKFLIDNKILDDSYQLQPTTMDNSINSSLKHYHFYSVLK